MTPLPEIDSETRTGSDAVTLDCYVPATLPHFAGHFPGMPILPGVVQIDWAVRLAARYFALPAGFRALDNIKFLAVVLPDTRLQLALKFDGTRKRLSFAYTSAARTFSSGHIVFDAEP